MIRVLHCVSNMDRAGIETMLMNYYRYIDKEKVQFDFLCNKSKKGAYENEILKMGGRIFVTPGLNPFKYIKYLKYMKSLFNEHPEYQIIEAHNGALGVYALYAAKKNNIKNRIFHAHGASITRDLKMPIKLFCKTQLKNNINYNFTCGLQAAKYYFGKKSFEQGDYKLIPNAIEIDKFIFNNNVRNKIRNQYELHDKKVIGHVGRFMSQKNHEFILNLFEKIHKSDPTTYLVLLGDGELLDKMKLKAQKLGISESIIFAGNVSNVNEWYQAFDLFVLPSIWEGLPVVGVEAQAADLPCIFSDNVTTEIGLSDSTKFMSIDDMDMWINHIQAVLKDQRQRKDNTKLITDNNYNIKIEAQNLQSLYLQITGEKL